MIGGSAGVFGAPSVPWMLSAVAAATCSAILLREEVAGVDDDATDVDSPCWALCSCLAFFFSSLSTLTRMLLRLSSSLTESRRASSMALSSAMASGDGSRLRLNSGLRGGIGIPLGLDAPKLLSSGCRLCPNGLIKKNQSIYGKTELK